jgi:predicted SAM-dependent methyltransferase
MNRLNRYIPRTFRKLMAGYSDPIRVIVGAGGTTQPGWLSLEENQLDIRDYYQWAERFAPSSIDAILAEHVLEHIPPTEAETAARNFFRFLKPGGYARIAVPDGYHPDPQYQFWTSPDGWDPTHKWIPNVQTLSQLLARAGFIPTPLEYWTPDGQFIQQHWRQEDGPIGRCPGTLQNGLLSVFAGCDYTSLVVDAVKP